MGSKFHIFLWLSLMWSSCSELELDLDMDMTTEDTSARSTGQLALAPSCAAVRPTSRDIVRRFYAILPYFDKEKANTLFLHKLRATINSMSEGDDVLDREAAFYAAVLSPVIFLQQYRDTWCLLERFHRALRLYQTSHPAEKRSALKLLQNLRAVNSKVRSFISNLPGPLVPTRSTPPPEFDEEEIRDHKDIRYLKELIKNLGR
ncbi:uncharacterized protein [Choristoneura fumiferana]|uniref:uncharacterized protein n=1 Tax=Choristoneura fumiferana TaxID=7141 RepID=UPI003D159F10